MRTFIEKKRMKTSNQNLMTLEEFKVKNYGKRGSKKREELEQGYENFKIGALLHQARLQKYQYVDVSLLVINLIKK